MKTASPALESHLALNLTTLATLWKITRVDGNVFGFTNHDQDITYDGTTYEAATGYSRTAVAHRSDMSVSELEVQGLLDEVRDILDANLLNSDAITDVDLRNGKFNGAVVEIYIVNWNDLTQGDVKILKGNLGRVSIRDRVYTAELRGLLHRYQKTIGEQTSPSCRADLFDSRCTLDPDDFREENRVASATDRRVFVYSGTVAPGGGGLGICAIVNNDAETGDQTGWEQATGTDAAMPVNTSMGAVIPAGGSNYLFGTTLNYETAGLQQTVSLTPSPITEAMLDSGRMSLYWYGQVWADDTERYSIWRATFLDYLGNTITTEESDPKLANTSSWVLTTNTFPIPIGSRTAIVAFIGYRGEPTGDNDVGFENFGAWVYDWGDSDLTGTGDYYDGGHLEWLSGGNQGLSMEIKTVDVGTNTINLFLPMPWTIEASHRFAIWPGCQKRLQDDCKTKFSNVVNFRGEPYLPGQDLLFRFPDAQ